MNYPNPGARLAACALLIALSSLPATLFAQSAGGDTAAASAATSPAVAPAAAPATAPMAQAPATPAPATPAPAEPVANPNLAGETEVVCRTVRVSGSRLRKEKICTSRAGAQDAREWVKRHQDHSSAAGSAADVNGGG